MLSVAANTGWAPSPCDRRSEEHTSELQSLYDLVCRLLLEKKKKPATRTVKVFFFNDTATTEIYTLSLHDALPILAVSPFYALGCREHGLGPFAMRPALPAPDYYGSSAPRHRRRSATNLSARARPAAEPGREPAAGFPRSPCDQSTGSALGH